MKFSRKILFVVLTSVLKFSQQKWHLKRNNFSTILFSGNLGPMVLLKPGEFLDLFESYIFVEDIRGELNRAESFLKFSRQSPKRFKNGIFLLDKILKKIVTSTNTIFRTSAIPTRFQNVEKEDQVEQCDEQNSLKFSRQPEVASSEISIGDLEVEDGISLPRDLFFQTPSVWTGHHWVESHFWKKRMSKYEEILKYKMQEMYLIISKCWDV